VAAGQLAALVEVVLKVNSRNFALTEFYEVRFLHATPKLRQRWLI
jgi:hypothetical protein